MESAIQLFSLFCNDSRHASDWRTSELRIINDHIVPVLYGLDVQIDWQHPTAALDKLERLVDETPPPAHFRRKPASADKTILAGGHDNCSLPVLCRNGILANANANRQF